MISLLKVSSGVTFLLALVIIPVILFSALFVYLTSASRAEEQSPDKHYITLAAYQQDGPQRSAVSAERLISCQRAPELCMTLEEELSAPGVKSCPGTTNPRVLVQSTVGGRAMVSSDCPGYQQLDKIVNNG